MSFDRQRVGGHLGRAADLLAAIDPEAPIIDAELRALLSVLADELSSSEHAASAREAALRLEAATPEDAAEVVDAVAAVVEALHAELAAAAPPAAPDPGIEADDPLLFEFLAECSEHIEKAEGALLVLEEDPTDADRLNEVFRAFHTIKGGAGMLNLRLFSEFAHRSEALLDAARSGELRLAGEPLELCYRSIDVLKEFVAAFESGDLTGDPSDDRLPVIEGIGAVLAGADEAGEREPREAAAGEGEAVLSPKRRAGAGPPRAAASVKVATERLDSLVDLVGELVIATSMVHQELQVSLGVERGSLRSVNSLAKVTGELQAMAMSMRMVPLKPTFQKAARLVRDLGAKSGKPVRFTIDGEETELDRNVVEKLGDPLVHMLRNAVDHGLESSEARVAAGKPAEGHVHLCAFHQGGNVVLQLSDDGGGIDRERLVQKAVQRGILAQSEVSELNDAEILELIFHPGFSTAEKVTDVSGRGVGMDVVRQNLLSLRGSIDIESTPGKGTSFTIRLPLTLAIIDGMVVRCGDRRYILPTLAVENFLRCEPGQITTVQGRGEVIRVRDRVMPVYRLHRIFNIENAITDPAEGLVVILQGEDGPCTLLIDDLLGQQQVVIKSMGDVFGRTPGISGAAVLGDGTVGLILDTSGLIRLALGRTRGATSADPNTPEMV